MAQRVTLARVAEATGVSVMTVSNVLNGRPGAADATRERVLAAAEELGYTPAARGARSERTGHIGVVMLDLTNQYSQEILRGIADSLANAELEVLVSASYQDSTREFERVDFLTGGVVDGLILVAPELEARTIELLKSREKPYFVVDPRELEAPVPRIIVDNYEGSRAATQHLIDLGHRRIAFIQGEPDFESSIVRRRGFEDAITLAGLDLDDALIGVSDFLYVPALREAKRILTDADRPTAIIGGADIFAFAAIDAARELNLGVPKDVSIVGFDDLPRAAHSFPGLTTVRQPLYEIGQLAGRIVADQANGESPLLERILLPTKLIVRGSTGTP